MKLTEVNNSIEELIHEANGMKDTKQDKIFNPLLKILRLTIFMTLSRQRLSKINDSLSKSKNELNQLNNKIEELKISIKVRKKKFLLIILLNY